MIMKRSISDSELSDDDFGDDDRSNKTRSPSQGFAEPGDRKKRRGVIEKRRRDRINSSLSELRRLVPTAFEKQGSAKLEKAEILQMTVDHLKFLHQKGINGYNFDPTTLAMDYRSVGFRECAAEVSRYLIANEGMDVQDPLRLRLISHLQSHSVQRDASVKNYHPNPLQSNPWGTPVPSPHSMQPSQYACTNASISSYPGGTGPIFSQPNLQSEQFSVSHVHHPSLSSVSCSDPVRLSQNTDNSQMRLSNVSLSQQTSIHPSQLTGSPLHPQFSGIHSQYPVSLNMSSMNMLSHGGAPPNGGAYPPGLTNASLKPYRPWGAELAY